MLKSNSNLNAAPFGKDVDFAEWEIIFKRVLKESSQFSFYDGEVDMTTTLLGYELESEGQSRLIVDQLLPNRGEIIFQNQSHLLVRAQYYSAGLQHRISFRAVLLSERLIGKYPALEIAIIPPIKRISNLYVAYPSDDKPVFLEIPVEGAPPEVRVIELSMEKLKAYNPGFRRVLPKTKKLEGIKLQFVDLGEVLIDGKIVKKSKKDFDINLDELNPESQDLFDKYMTKDYLENNKPMANKHGFNIDNDLSAQEVVSNWINDKVDKTDDVRLVDIQKLSGGDYDALLIIKNDKVRDLLINLIAEMGYNISEYKYFEDVYNEEYKNKKLLIFDAQQKDDSAVDILRNLIGSREIDKTPFIIVGQDRVEAKESEWDGLGKGLFLKSSLPYTWIESKVKTWLSEQKNISRPVTIADEPVLLVISEDDTILELVDDFSSSLSAEIKYANDRNTALHYTRTCAPSLIILDIDSKNADGIELLHVIRSYRTTQNIPVIIISTETDKVLIQQALDLGISDYLLKPVDISTLIRRTNQILT